jgi:hypothetical protein
MRQTIVGAAIWAALAGVGCSPCGPERAELTCIQRTVRDMAPDEYAAVHTAWIHDLGGQTFEGFTAQQLDLYLTVNEGDPRIHTWFYGTTVDRWMQCR